MNHRHETFYLLPTICVPSKRLRASPMALYFFFYNSHKNKITLFCGKNRVKPLFHSKYSGKMGLHYFLLKIEFSLKNRVYYRVNHWSKTYSVMELFYFYGNYIGKNRVPLEMILAISSYESILRIFGLY